MRCPSCGRALPTAFPGARIPCACGHVLEVAGAPARGPVGSGPYREASASAPSAPSATCPFCGNECPPLVRICPHCDVRLESVRCAGCFSLQAPGAFSCSRCGKALEREPLLDATDAPCPRCAHPLEAPATTGAEQHEGDPRLRECPRCGGLFVTREVLADILCRAEAEGPLATAGPAPPVRAALDPVRYVPCPLCHATMNRVNFGKASGVIVDVCRAHGTWFDAGELTRVVAFAASGGLAKTREREAATPKELGERAAEARAQVAALEAGQAAERRLDAWRELLAWILG